MANESIILLKEVAISLNSSSLLNNRRASLSPFLTCSITFFILQIGPATLWERKIPKKKIRIRKRRPKATN